MPMKELVLPEGHMFKANVVLMVATFCAFICHATSCPGQASQAAANAEKILIQRPFGEKGATLVVVLGPDVSPALFSTWKTRGLDQVARAYEVRIELRS